MRGYDKVHTMESVARELIEEGYGYFDEYYGNNLSNCLKAKVDVSNAFLNGQLTREFEVMAPKYTQEELHIALRDLVEQKIPRPPFGSDAYAIGRTWLKEEKTECGRRIIVPDRERKATQEEKDLFFKTYMRDFFNRSDVQQAIKNNDARPLYNSFYVPGSLSLPLARVLAMSVNKWQVRTYDAIRLNSQGIMEFKHIIIDIPIAENTPDPNKITNDDKSVVSMKSPKFTKELRRLIFEWSGNQEWADWALNIASQMIQFTKNTNGEIPTKVVLSVHPLDYVAISIAEGWSSCLSPDGEYASGPLALMNDRGTMVLYIASKHTEYKTNSYHIPNKRYRCLVHTTFDENGAIVGFVQNKHYPSDTPVFTEVLSELAEENGFEKTSLHEVDISVEASEFTYDDLTGHSVAWVEPDRHEDSHWHIQNGAGVLCIGCGKEMWELEYDDGSEGRRGYCYSCMDYHGLIDHDQCCGCCEECENPC